MLQSLRGRLILLTIIALLTTGGLALILISDAIESTFVAYVTEQEEARLTRVEGLQLILPEMLSAYYEKHPERADWESITQDLNWLVPDSLLLPTADGTHAGGVRIPADATNTFCETLLPVTKNGQLISQVCFNNVSQSLKLADATPFRNSVQRSLIITLLIAGGLALFLTAIFAHHLLRPLEALTKAVRTVARGTTPHPLPTSSIAEIHELTTAFNSMAERLNMNETLRRNMVSDVAHELRTPLTNVYGYLEAINDGVVEVTPELISSLTEEVALLNYLVGDLQDLALAEAGQLPLYAEPVEIGSLISATMKLIQLSADQNSIQLSMEQVEKLPLVTVDPLRIGQVLRNLIGNAVTNTPAGGRITVSASTNRVVNNGMSNSGISNSGISNSGMSNNGMSNNGISSNGMSNHGMPNTSNALEVRISNTGEPIKAEHLPFVFERFYRSDQARARATGGHGLGLAIVKHLIEAHGGQVGVESNTNSGTSFFFTLPLAAEM